MASGFQVVFLIFAFQFGAMLATRLASAPLGLSDEHFATLSKVVWISLAIAVILAFRRLRQDAARTLAFPIPPDRAWETGLVAACLVAVPLAVFGGLAIGSLANGEADALRHQWSSITPDQVWSDSMTPVGALRILVFACVLGPVVEEIVFRGWLFRAWQRRWGWKASMTATAVVFGLCHPGHAAQVITTAIASVAFTALLLRTGSLRACIVAHGAYNLLLQAPLLGQVIFRQRFGDYTGWRTWSLEWACLAFVAVALPAYLVLAARTRRDLAPGPA